MKTCLLKNCLDMNQMTEYQRSIVSLQMLNIVRVQITHVLRSSKSNITN